MSMPSTKPLKGSRSDSYAYGSINGPHPTNSADDGLDEDLYNDDLGGGYEAASALSSLVFGWIAPLLRLGNKKDQLDPSDLRKLPLPLSCHTEKVITMFDEEWADAVFKARSHATAGRLSSTASDDTDAAAEKETFWKMMPAAIIRWCQNRRHRSMASKPPPPPSLARCLFGAYGRDFVRAGFLKLVHDLLAFVGPQVLDKMIAFLRDGDASFYRGLNLTLVVTLSQLLMSLTLRHYFFLCFTVGLRVRTAIVMAVYRKALVLAASERQTRTTGEITNLISIDAQRMQDLITYLHAIWYSGLQIIIAIYFLWQQLGPSCLGGVAVIVVMMPVTKSVAKFMGRRQKKLMKAKDGRVEINNEVLGAMKNIKLQGWERSFQAKIELLRKGELRELLNYMLGNSFTIMLWSAVPLLVALATFATYVWAGNELDVAVALTSLALFEILRFPLFMLPQVINNIVEALVSLGRIQSFLLCAEHKQVGPGKLKEDGRVRIDNASFVYDSKRAKLVDDEDDGVGKWMDPTTRKEIADAKWEIILLKSQLADVERELMERKDADGLGLNLDSDPVYGKEYGESKNLLALRRVNLECYHELIAVVGAVGSGKSTLINSILGEIRTVSGSVSVKGRIAYFGQTPFIMNDTVRANVTLGRADKPFDEKWYKKCLSVCALKHDLTTIPGGDMCEIGEKGITLSGGQKARVAMARAVYHDADVYLLDDPLAAVDAHVGRHMFQRCIIDTLIYGVGRGEEQAGRENGKKKSTVILVTNALQYLSNPCVDRIVVLTDGIIQEQGTYAQLTQDPSSRFSNLLQSFQDSMGTQEVDGEENDEMNVPSFSSSSLNALTDVPDEPEVANVLSPKQKPGLVQLSRDSLKRDQSVGEKSVDLATKANSTTTDEFRERQTGHVSLSVYLAWCKAAGGVWVGLLVLIGFAGVEGINVLSRWWLTYWSLHGSEGEGSQAYYLTIYAVINMSSVLASFCRLTFVMLCGLRASRKIFSSMLDSIMKAKMSFFDTTPIGRIVNRFSKDMYTVDEQLVPSIRGYLATLLSVFGVIAVISSVTPVFIFFLIPMIVFYWMQQNFFTKSYRELKRLDSVSRSPLYALLGETLDGISTIRAFAVQHTLVDRITSILNQQQNAYFLTTTAQCYLGVRLEFVGTLIIAFACLCAVFEHRSSGGNEKFASLAGLSISFSLSVTQALNWSVRMGSELEANMVAVERVQQYCEVPSEAPRIRRADKMIQSTWPESGEIVFKDAKMRYRPGLPLVLKGLKLLIPAKSKVGIVGRTGAGKSSLMVVLLRIVELESGSILVDGEDISKLGLTALRSKIAVIPQDPVLFTGTIRSNLDPFEECDDKRLQEVLQRVGLNANLTEGASVKSLSDPVYEGGSNFSVGQRQLLVIARALLRDASIVIMDEATAAVDAETDSRIQRVMRTEFKNATCLTVAHRVNTIMDSDYILVMDDGQVAEFDTPSVLLGRDGMFKDLVDTWEEEHKD